MGRFWMRNREFIVFVLAVILITGYTAHILKSFGPVEIKIPMTEDRATVPGNAPGGP